MIDQGHPEPLDFNDCAAPVEMDRGAERNETRTALLARLESVLSTIFPAGKVRRGKFHIGDILGSPGDSLEIVVDGDKAGLWTDRATGDGGDIFDLLARHMSVDVHADFARVLQYAGELAGRASG
jgi:putative DNA primase/helicase